jgi:hypothetical protein
MTIVLFCILNFVRPKNIFQSGCTKIIGGTQMMLERVSRVLGYDPPSFRTETRGARHRCFVDFFAPGGNGSREFAAVGRVSASAGEAIETTVYNALLAFSVNRKIMINDSNHDAYVFAKEVVDQVTSDVQVMGDAGNNICSYLDSTHRALKLVIGAFSRTLRHHPSGEQLAEKLEALTSEVHQCLTAITGSVRMMNQNVAIALLPFYHRFTDHLSSNSTKQSEFCSSSAIGSNQR